MSEYISVSEAAKILQVSRPYVYKLINDKRLAAEKRPTMRGTIRIRKEDAERLAEVLAYQPTSPKG